MYYTVPRQAVIHHDIMLLQSGGQGCAALLPLAEVWPNLHLASPEDHRPSSPHLPVGLVENPCAGGRRQTTPKSIRAWAAVPDQSLFTNDFTHAAAGFVTTLFNRIAGGPPINKDRAALVAGSPDALARKIPPYGEGSKGWETAPTVSYRPTTGSCLAGKQFSANFRQLLFGILPTLSADLTEAVYGKFPQG